MNFQQLFLDDLNDLKEKYLLKDLRAYEVTLGGKFIVSFVYVKDEQSLFENWKELGSALTQVYDKYLNDDFTKWNMYIIFLVETQISKALEYQIENDTFAFRKMIKKEYREELSEENVDKLLSTYIDFTDITVSSVDPVQQAFESDSIVYKKLSNIDKLTEEKMEAIFTSLGRNTDEV